MVSYGSAQTSTSGILVEDVLHLATEDGAHENLLKTTLHLGELFYHNNNFNTLPQDSILLSFQLRFENRRMKCSLVFMRLLDPCAEKLHVSLMQVNYDMEDYNNFPTEPHASMAPPAVAAGHGSNSSTGSTKETRNDSCSIASPCCHSHTSVLTSLMSAFLLYILL